MPSIATRPTSLHSFASSGVGMGLNVQPMMDCLIRPFLIRNFGSAFSIGICAWEDSGAVSAVVTKAVDAADLRIVRLVAFINLIYSPSTVYSYWDLFKPIRKPRSLSRWLVTLPKRAADRK